MRRIWTTAAVACATGAGLCHADEDEEAIRAETWRRLARTMVRVDFDGQPLRDVLAHLSALAEVDLVADWTGGAMSAGTASGLNPDTPVRLEFQAEMPLVTVLEVVLERAATEPATWSLEGGHVLVATKESLANRRYVRVYPVQDLLARPREFDERPRLEMSALPGPDGAMLGPLFATDEEPTRDQERRLTMDPAMLDLVDLLTSIVEPEAWDVMGGSSSIRPMGGVLVVNAPDHVHRALGGVLGR